MNEVDQKYTSFQVARKIFCYNVMPFGLKNTRATYQRMVDKVFEKHTGRNAKVYVDDMVVKTPTGKFHLEDLNETFDTLMEYRLKLNPTKCTFGVHSKKFLGFMMTERGIEANPEKIEALISMVEPRCIKDVQRLKGCITALGRFISKSAKRCLPFFKIWIQATRTFTWNAECKRGMGKIEAISPESAFVEFARDGRSFIFIFIRL